MLAISSGTYLSPLIAGYVADNIGWRWIGWFGAIFNGVLLIIVYFALEETTFDRNAHLVLDGINRDSSEENNSSYAMTEKVDNEKMVSPPSEDVQDVIPHSVERPSHRAEEDIPPKNSFDYTCAKFPRYRL